MIALRCPFGRRARGKKWSRRGGVAGGGRFRGRRVDRGEREASGAADADGRQAVSGMRLGFTSSDAGSTVPGWRWMVAQDSQARLNRSRGGRGTHRSWSCEDRGLRGWRLGPRSGVPKWRLTAFRASGRNGIGFDRRGSDSALSPRRRTWASLVRRGRKNSCLRRAMVAGDGSATVRGRLARRLQHFASTGERASGGRQGERTAVRRRGEAGGG